MIEWIVERIQAVINLVPPLLVSEDSPNFALGRTMLALLLIVLVVYVIVMRPFGSFISQCFSKMTNLVARKK